MKTTIGFLNDLKSRHGLHSDYGLAKFLGITRSNVSKLMSGQTTLGDENAIKVADSLKIPRPYVLACVHFERAKNDPEKSVWRDIMERFGGVASAVFIGLGVVLLMKLTGRSDPLFLLSVAPLTQYTLYEVRFVVSEALRDG